MTVGERIKEMRMRLNMSQVAFAEKLEVSKQTLYKYENNIITNIPSDKIEKAAELGNVTPAYLMGWDAELEQRKEKMKNYAQQWNIQFFEKKMLNSFSQLNDENKKKCISYTENLLANQKMEEEVLVNTPEVPVDNDTLLLSKDNKEYDEIKSKLPELKKLRKKNHISQSAIATFLRQAGYDKMLSTNDIVLIINGLKVPSRQLYEDIYSFLTDNYKIVLGKDEEFDSIQANAANQRTDIEMPEDTDTSDNNIMDGEKF